MKKIFVLIVGWLLTISVFSLAEEGKNIVASNHEKSICVACVGDSITKGAGIRNPDKTYPAQLEKLLGAGWNVQNFGHNGTTALKKSYRPYWTQSEFQAATHSNPDIVILLLGANDAHPPIWESGKNEFAADFGALIDHFTALPSKPCIWICLPAPIMPGLDDKRLQNLRNEVTPLIAQEAGKRNIPVIDLYTPLENKAHFFVDKIHPTDRGAAIIAEKIFEALKEIKPVDSKL